MLWATRPSPDTPPRALADRVHVARPAVGGGFGAAGDQISDRPELQADEARLDRELAQVAGAVRSAEQLYDTADAPPTPRLPARPIAPTPPR